MTVDWTKPIQTRDGRRAEFVRKVKARSDTQRVWCVVEHSGFEEMASFSEDGQHFEVPTNYDIINVPEEQVECVINLYDGKYYTDHCNRSLADSRSRKVRDRTHVVTIKRIGDEVTATVERVR